MLDAVWAIHIHLSFTATGGRLLVLAAALSVTAGFRASRIRRGALIAEYFALTMAATTAICVLSYLCIASAGPLVDSRLMAMDRALGFDWLAGYRFVHAHPQLSAMLELAYDSLIVQGLYFCLLHGLMDCKQRLRDMFWLFLACGALACLGALLFPALGPSKFYNIATDTSFVAVAEHLLSGRDLSFSLSQMAGVISFPSFHTSMALAYAWAFRKTGIIGAAVVGLNLVMLCAVPFFGGHYLVDMVAGAATMLVSLALVRTAPGFWRLWSRGERGAIAIAIAQRLAVRPSKTTAASASPESAARSADAY
ncbi:MAG TPA: phosphatase PAP2 family protein [Rhizomicrobium sp.]|nr:phosphatase PAP2 family protein [Rhizomicrobium sp.]